LEAKEKERKKTAHATDDAPKKPVRKLKSEVTKMTGKELQKDIDREAQALNVANRDSNLKEMAVKISKMGPEVHAAYVRDKNDDPWRHICAGWILNPSEHTFAGRSHDAWEHICAGSSICSCRRICA